MKIFIYLSIVLMGVGAVNVAQASNNEEAYQLYMAAQQAYKANDFNEAQRLAEQAIDIEAEDQNLTINRRAKYRFSSFGRGLNTSRYYEGDKVAYYPNKLISYIRKRKTDDSARKRAEKKKANPPRLFVQASLVDADNDGTFYEEEPLELVVAINNLGKGDAHDLTLIIDGSASSNELVYRTGIPVVKSEDQVVVSESFKLPRSFEDDEIVFAIKVDEIDGFSADSLHASFKIQPWSKPRLTLVPHKLFAPIKPGRVSKYEFLLRNDGNAPARDFALFTELATEGLNLVEEQWPEKFSFLGAGEERVLSLYLKAGIAIEADVVPKINLVYKDLNSPMLAESFAALAEFTIPIEFDKRFQFGNRQTRLVTAKAGLPPSELRRPRIAKNHNVSKRDYALVIGNRDYDKMPDLSVPYALNDAKLMASIFENNLGIPQSNIFEYDNVTLGDIKALLGEEGRQGIFQRAVQSASSEQIETVYVFYSGHGVPAINDNWSAYLMPSDANPDYIDVSGYALEEFYDQLSLIDAKNIVVFLDACFSGYADGGSLFPSTSASILMEPDVALPLHETRLSVLSATQSKGVAVWFNQLGNGLFTNYLARGLSGEADDGDRVLSTRELFRFVERKVTGVAATLGRSQVPSMYATSDVALVEYDY